MNIISEIPLHGHFYHSVYCNNNFNWGGVRYTLDSVLKELIFDREKRFVFAEMAFF